MSTPTAQTSHAPLELLDELLFVDPESPEWAYMWDQLGDPQARCPVTGEVWQYMGSFRQGDRYQHEMRHRHLPSTGRREIRLIPASDDQMAQLRDVARELAARTSSLRPEAEVLGDVERSWDVMVEANR